MPRRPVTTLAAALVATLLATTNASAATDVGQYIGEIQKFGFGYCPAGWAPTDGRLMPIPQNTALFSILGTQYGGDGQNTYALPKISALAEPSAASGGVGRLTTTCIALTGIFPARP